jgi:hypothetical protein
MDPFRLDLDRRLKQRAPSSRSLTVVIDVLPMKKTDESFEFSLSVKRDALGPHIAFVRNSHPGARLPTWPCSLCHWSLPLQQATLMFGGSIKG